MKHEIQILASIYYDVDLELGILGGDCFVHVELD